MRNNIVDMGLEPERLYNAMKRFKKLGERGEYTRRVPTYQILKLPRRLVVNPDNPYHFAGRTRWCWLSDRYPNGAAAARSRRWFKELTHEPAA